MLVRGDDEGDAKLVAYLEWASGVAVDPRQVRRFVAVLEEAERVAFLYKIVRGSTDHSYGIYAAQVAGLPKAVISRAKEILASLEMGNAVEVVHPGSGGEVDGGPSGGMVQLTLFDVMGHPVVERLREVNVEKLTPLEALNLLAQLRRLVQ